MLTVFISGAGGGIGQGVIKCLKQITDLDIRIIAADMSELAVGLYAADIAYKVPAVRKINHKYTHMYMHIDMLVIVYVCKYMYT